MNMQRSDRGSTETEAERINRTRWRAVGLALQFGSTVVGAFLIGLGGGIWLDRRLGTSPLFLFVGLILAFVAVGYSLYEIARVGTPRRAPNRTPGRSVSPAPDDDDRADDEAE